MSEYLSSDLSFKNTDIEKLRSSLRFIFNTTPEDIPFNSIYGVKIPTDILVDDFCKSYSKNLKNTIDLLKLPVTIESVSIDSNNLRVELRYNTGKLETWSLSL